VTRAVLDTNVLVSALINRYGPPRHIFKAWRQGRFELITSLPCLLELEDVLRRPRIHHKYKLGEDDIYRYILLLGTQGTVVPVPEETSPMCRDPDDDKFLVCALVGQAQVIVSGDPDLVQMNGVAGVAVVTPRDFAVATLGGWQPALPGLR
jgi:putative PIN family toxin of toxin-antitoxin system